MPGAKEWIIVANRQNAWHSDAESVEFHVLVSVANVAETYPSMSVLQHTHTFPDDLAEASR